MRNYHIACRAHDGERGTDEFAQDVDSEELAEKRSFTISRPGVESWPLDLPFDRNFIVTERPVTTQGHLSQDEMGLQCSHLANQPRLNSKRSLKRTAQVHVSRSSGLAKAILQGTVKGGRRRGRQEEVGRQHQGMDRPGVRQVPEGSGEQGKMEKTGCKIICGAPTTLAVKG